jgi:hypothetical protein
MTNDPNVLAEGEKGFQIFVVERRQVSAGPIPAQQDPGRSRKRRNVSVIAASIRKEIYNSLASAGDVPIQMEENREVTFRHLAEEQEDKGLLI